MSTQALTALVEKLQGKKYKLLNELKSSVKKHIAAKKTEDCLIVVTKPVNERTTSGVRWDWSDGLPFVQRLICFLQQKNYRGNGKTYIVDSILTEEVAAIVSRSFSIFYKSESELISKYAVAHILENQKIAKALVESLVKNSKVARYASNKVKHQMMDILLNGLLSQKEQIQSQIGHSIVVGTSKATAAIVSSKLVTSIGTAATSAMGKVMVKHISVYIIKSIGVVTTKVMSVPIIKALVMKFAAAAIVGAFVKFIAVKAGISIGAAVAVVLLPILVGILAHEWDSFPEKLGESIASSICGEIDTNFIKTNKEALTNVFQQLLEEQVEAIGKHLAENEEIADKMGEILDFVHS